MLTGQAVDRVEILWDRAWFTLSKDYQNSASSEKKKVGHVEFYFHCNGLIYWA